MCQSEWHCCWAAWGALLNQTAWETTANGLKPPVPSAAQYMEGGASAIAATPGEVLFIMNYGLYLIGASSAAPNNTPPTYS